VSESITSPLQLTPTCPACRAEGMGPKNCTFYKIWEYKGCSKCCCIPPTHHPDYPVFINFFHLPRSIASSLFKLRAWQSSCITSLQHTPPQNRKNSNKNGAAVSRALWRCVVSCVLRVCQSAQLLAKVGCRSQAALCELHSGRS